MCSEINRYDVRFSYEYRSNPSNKYHYVYKAIVDRVFIASIVLMCQIMAFVSYGAAGVLLYPIIGIAAICFFAIEEITIGTIKFFLHWVNAGDLH